MQLVFPDSWLANKVTFFDLLWFAHLLVMLLDTGARSTRVLSRWQFGCSFLKAIKFRYITELKIPKYHKNGILGAHYH